MTSETDRFRCIRCDTKFDVSKRTLEHVYGYSIGGALTIRDVCKPCNDVLGAMFDAPLVDHLLVQMKRHRFKIAGHDGHVPDPLGTPGRAADDPDMRVQFQPEGGLRILPSVKRTVREDGSESKTFTFDPRDATARDAAVRKLVQRSLRRGREVRVSAPTVRNVGSRLQLDHEVPRLDWTFGMIKIGYELAYLVAGPAWLDDAVAVRLRSFLRGDEPTLEQLASSGIQAHFRGFGTPQEMDRSEGFEEWNHFGRVANDRGRLVVEVRVFETFGMRLIVSGEARGYSVSERGVAFGLDGRTRDFLRFDEARLTFATPGARAATPSPDGGYGRSKEGA